MCSLAKDIFKKIIMIVIFDVHQIQSTKLSATVPVPLFFYYYHMSLPILLFGIKLRTPTLVISVYVNCYSHTQYICYQ